MTRIPSDHELAPVHVAEYRTERRDGRRAFTHSDSARRWVEEQLEQDLPWERTGKDRWEATTEWVDASVVTVPLHDPSVLKRRYPDAFNGDYENKDT